MKLSVFEIGRQLWQLRIGRGGFSRPGLHAGVNDGRYRKKDEEEVGENI